MTFFSCLRDCLGTSKDRSVYSYPSALEVLCDSLTIHIRITYAVHYETLLFFSRTLYGTSSLLCCIFWFDELSMNYLEVSRVLTIRCLTRPSDEGPQTCTGHANMNGPYSTISPVVRACCVPSTSACNDRATHWAGRSNEHDNVLPQQAEHARTFFGLVFPTISPVF